MHWKSLRAARRVGKALYVSIPRVAQLEMRLFPGDWVELHLDDETKELTIRPCHARVEVPLIRFHRPDMVPATALAIPDPPKSPRRTPETPLLETIAS